MTQDHGHHTKSPQLGRQSERSNAFLVAVRCLGNRCAIGYTVSCTVRFTVSSSAVAAAGACLSGRQRQRPVGTAQHRIAQIQAESTEINPPGKNVLHMIGLCSEHSTAQFPAG